MDRNEQIAATIRDVCRREELLAGAPDDQDFFECGVSSLAVIHMQIRLEEALNITVPTGELMAQSTINDWIRLFTRQASATMDLPYGRASEG